MKRYAPFALALLLDLVGAGVALLASTPKIGRAHV